jgi:two-component system chemotaxis response regulator CheB
LLSTLAAGAFLTESQPRRRSSYGPSDDILELVVLGVSTGGPPLLMRLLKDLTKPAIPLLIVQHMPESETAGFAQRLSEESGLVVREMAAGPIACGRLARRAPRGR